jgi:hypothetical protein
MECNRIPAPELWDQLEPKELESYRLHIQYCAGCRARVLNQAPDQLLYDIQIEPLPDDFWLGFWDSVNQKRWIRWSRPSAIRASLRKAAVFIIGLLILLYGRPIREESGAIVASAQISRAANLASQKRDLPSLPVIENLENPDARYYIFQSGEQEKIVMVFDPDMEL